MAFSLSASLCPDTSHIGLGPTYPSITSLHLQRPFAQINPRFEVLRVRTSTDEFFVGDAIQLMTPPMVVLGYLRKCPSPSSASQSVTSPSLPGHFLTLAPRLDHLLCPQTAPSNSHLLFHTRSLGCLNPGREPGSRFPLIPSGDVCVCHSRTAVLLLDPWGEWQVLKKEPRNTEISQGSSWCLEALAL